MTRNDYSREAFLVMVFALLVAALSQCSCSRAPAEERVDVYVEQVHVTNGDPRVICYAIFQGRDVRGGNCIPK